MVFLNIDAGERPDEPEELYALADWLSVACGGHAGDDASMGRACELVKAHGRRLGFHPSYEDRTHFGRVVLEQPVEVVAASVRRQCDRFVKIALQKHREAPLHLKLHGALYHEANRDPVLARAVIEAAREVLPVRQIIGPPEGAFGAVARSLGLEFLREGFADRRYLPDGRLAPRSLPDVLVTDPKKAAAQAKRLVREGRVDTICVHSNSPHAVDVARAVREALREMRAVRRRAQS